MTIAIGHSLGRYRIESVLGRGGMAEVYRARDRSLDRDVAIKVILPDLSAESQFLERFETEAKLVASLDHPNILPIFDFGEHRGQPFVVMPLLPGGTLAERLAGLRAGGRTVPLGTALDWTRQIASALDAAHEAGVLHRDVKPGNILVGRRQRLFLADFGIARLYDATARLTRTGTVVGTPLYMAPEVAAGADAGTAADLYSLAVIVYEMLAGRPPFDGDNLLAILNQHATRPVPPITDHDPRMPAEIDGALARGLAKKPAERPPTCGDFVTLLTPGAVEPAAAGEPVSATARTVPLASREALTGPSASPSRPPPATTTVAPARQWLLAGLAGALVALGGFLLLRLSTPPPAGAPGPTARVETAPAATGAELPPPGGAGEMRPPVPAAGPHQPAPPPTDSSAATLRDRPAGPAPGLPGGGSAAPRFAEVRGLRRRSRPEDFRRLIEGGERLAADDVAAGPGAAVRLFAEGAMAYIEGRREVAETALLRLLGEPRFLRFWGPSPLTWIAHEAAVEKSLEDWQLAIGYGDPLAELAGILERLAPEAAAAGGDPRWSFARALVHRLDGEPEGVLERALPVWDRSHGDQVPAEVRSYLAQLIADAYRDVGRTEESLDWYRRAVAAGGIHLGVIAAHAAEIAHQLQRLPEALGFLRQACEADHRPACQELRRATARGRFAPRRPGPG